MTFSPRRAGCQIFLLCLFAAGLLQAEERSSDSRRFTPLVYAINEARQCCVDIDTEKTQKSLDVVFPSSKSSKVNGMGTGIIIDERGYIVTNYHVVEGVDRLRVTLRDGSKYDATVFVSDARRDLSIIRINPTQQLKVMPLGTSSDLMLAEEVWAIGNAFGYNGSVTRGIISALGRNVDVNEEQGYLNLIQTDAAINPGNSGGPLLNADGELIGINVAIRQGAQKIGFAIPVDDARKVIAELMSIERHDRTYHGMEVMDVKQGKDRRLVVRAVVPNSPAAAAGVQPGDLVLRSRETAVIDAVDLERSLLGLRPGTEVPLTIQRGQSEESLKLKLASLMPDRSRPGRSSMPTPSVAAAIPPALPSTVPGSSTAASERAWRMLGLRLAPLTPGEAASLGQTVNGGMRVVEVRAESPAAEKGVMVGDVLLGLHVWETASIENVEYVLKLPDLSKLSPLKFYIQREGLTLYGHFDTMTASR